MFYAILSKPYTCTVSLYQRITSIIADDSFEADFNYGYPIKNIFVAIEFRILLLNTHALTIFFLVY